MHGREKSGPDSFVRAALFCCGDVSGESFQCGYLVMVRVTVVVWVMPPPFAVMVIV
jgi:hypothetical protein